MQMNPSGNRIMDIENRLVVAIGKGIEGGMQWEAAVSRYRLLYIEGIKQQGPTV